MSLAGYQRDPARVRANLVEMKNKSVVCKKPCKILVPARYQERQLAMLGSEVYILGIWAMLVDETFYGISMTNAMMQIAPTSIQTVKMAGDEYLEFSFDAGAKVFVTTDLIKTKTITYQIFDEFIIKGRVPWFLDYEDMAHLFDTAPHHAGKNIGGDSAIYEMMAATIARDPNNRRVYFRQVAERHEDQIDVPPVFVPFRSVIYNATNTTAALLGSHAGDGLASALVHPAERVEKIEELLRR